MIEHSKVNPKMLFEILTDKEIEELQERAIRQRNFYAANLLRGKQMSDPGRWRSQFDHRLFAAKTPASCWVVAASWNGAKAPVGSPPLVGAKD